MLRTEDIERLPGPLLIEYVLALERIHRRVIDELVAQGWKIETPDGYSVADEPS